MTGRAFDGKTVWITGASGGLGAALARAFHDAGARLILSARRAGALDHVARGLGPGAAGGTLLLPMDICDPAAVAAAAAEAAVRRGAIDVLVNNAGQTHRALFRDTDPAVYRRLFEVNVFGPLALTQAVLPGMAAAGGGRILVISSIAARYSSPYRSGYNAAKRALHGLFDSLRAEEHRNRIGVTLVVLGGVRTRVSVNALRGDGSAYGRMDPAIAQGMDPDAVARRIVGAAARRRDEIVIAPVAQRWLIWRKTWLPRLAARAVRLGPPRG